MSAFFGMIIAVVKMKIVVVSDSHGRDDALEYVLQQHGDAYAYIHCGDIDADPGAFPRFVSVGGNNDIFYDYPDEQILSIGTHFAIIGRIRPSAVSTICVIMLSAMVSGSLLYIPISLCIHAEASSWRMPQRSAAVILSVMDIRISRRMKQWMVSV